MRIRNLYPGSWGANCYLLINGNDAVVVDPSARADKILEALREENAQVRYILLTHGHFDHIVSLDSLREETGAKAYIHEGDFDFPADSYKNGFGYFFKTERSYRNPDGKLSNGQILALGDEEIQVIHTPGHTAGSVCYLCNNAFLLTGDTLFDGDRGRTDLYSGDEQTLLKTLESLRALEQDLPIYPGHGGPSTLGHALDTLW
jgi:glyoxylase-like metal-dependent hydrolase (beta-lactamase superfamily II)